MAFGTGLVRGLLYNPLAVPEPAMNKSHPSLSTRRRQNAAADENSNKEPSQLPVLLGRFASPPRFRFLFVTSQQRELRRNPNISPVFQPSQLWEPTAATGTGDFFSSFPSCSQNALCVFGAWWLLSIIYKFTLQETQYSFRSRSSLISLPVLPPE